jgi:CHAT domain-containing protein/tetratricopeptide (TPR) repeat protein
LGVFLRYTKGILPKKHQVRSSSYQFQFGTGSLNLKTAGILACCLLAASLVGGARKSTPNRRAAPLLSAEQRSRRSEPYRSRLERGRDLFRRGAYSDAGAIFLSVFENAQAHSLSDVAARALGDWGGCQFALHQHQAALRAYLRARELALASSDSSGAALWEANLASLYYEMGDLEASTQEIERSIQQSLDLERASHLPEMQIQMAMIRAEQGRMAEATQLFHKGIDGADRQANLALCILGWTRLGEALLAHGDLSLAEEALLQAYYQGKLHHLDLENAYRSLGRLRQSQGDWSSASVLLDAAVALTTKPQGSKPTWNLYQARGSLRMAQGRLGDALADLRVALKLGRAWRWSAPQVDAEHVATEGVLARVHSNFIEAGNRLYLRTHDRGLVGETFAADDENRAASLRALIGDLGQREPDLPPAYWESLGRLQEAEITALRGGGNPADLSSARADLTRLEASLGPRLRPSPAEPAELARRSLDGESAFFSFHLGDSISWVWALDRDGIEVYALPARDTIELQCRAAVAAIKEDRPEAAALSHALFQTLFAPIDGRFRRASRWLLALDDSLFDVPVAALVESLQPKTGYVAERHVVEVVPSAAYWLESLEGPATILAPTFVGVGDAIYNRADARFAGSRNGPDPLPLPRLVASRRELETAAQAWAGPAVLLRGEAASRENLLAQLRRRPTAVHLATHYLESAGNPHYGLIALSMSPAGQVQLLTPFEISHWRINAGVVVLSGCHSAAGRALPGTGVPGLTRAWLAAGAQSVVGTLWSTPDDDGVLFRALYRNLRSSPEMDTARALRVAQLDLIQAGGQQARPDYWGAYFVVGNQRKAVTPQ